jgi:hypothetical protein
LAPGCRSVQMAAGDVAVGAGLAGLEVAAFQTLLRPQQSPLTDHVPPISRALGPHGRLIAPTDVPNMGRFRGGAGIRCPFELTRTTPNAWPATPSGRRSAEESARRATRGAKRRLRPGWGGIPVPSGRGRRRGGCRTMPGGRSNAFAAPPRAGSQAFVVMRDYPRKGQTPRAGQANLWVVSAECESGLAPFGLTGPACGL